MSIRAFQPKVYQRFAVFWLILISLASSIPSINIVNNTVIGADKLIHLGVFAVFAYLIFGALREMGKHLGIKIFIVLVSLATISFGFIDEYHQSFVVGRIFSLWDLLADAIGGIIGANSFQKIHKENIFSPHNSV